VWRSWGAHPAKGGARQGRGARGAQNVQQPGRPPSRPCNHGGDAKKKTAQSRRKGGARAENLLSARVGQMVERGAANAFRVRAWRQSLVPKKVYSFAGGLERKRYRQRKLARSDPVLTRSTADDLPIVVGQREKDSREIATRRPPGRWRFLERGEGRLPRCVVALPRRHAPARTPLRAGRAWTWLAGLGRRAGRVLDLRHVVGKWGAACEISHPPLPDASISPAPPSVAKEVHDTWQAPACSHRLLLERPNWDSVPTMLPACCP
jgi:hypothetical protein